MYFVFLMRFILHIVHIFYTKICESNLILTLLVFLILLFVGLDVGDALLEVLGEELQLPQLFVVDILQWGEPVHGQVESLASSQGNLGVVGSLQMRPLMMQEPTPALRQRTEL